MQMQRDFMSGEFEISIIFPHDWSDLLLEFVKKSEAHLHPTGGYSIPCCCVINLGDENMMRK